MNDPPQPTSAVEIIASAMEEYDLPYERMIEEPTAGSVASDLLATWQPFNQLEVVVESPYCTEHEILEDVKTALCAQGVSGDLSALYQKIGKKLVSAARGYVFHVHSMNDADEAERLVAQRRREYQRELTQRREYE